MCDKESNWIDVGIAVLLIGTTLFIARNCHQSNNIDENKKEIENSDTDSELESNSSESDEDVNYDGEIDDDVDEVVFDSKNFNKK